MTFIIFGVAWLILLAIFIGTKGETEKDPVWSVLGWLCIATIIMVALITMFTINFRAGLGMVGSLIFLSTTREG